MKITEISDNLSIDSQDKNHNQEIDNIKEYYDKADEIDEEKKI